MNNFDFNKLNHPIYKILAGMIIVFSIIMIFKSGYITGQFLHSKLN